MSGYPRREVSWSPASSGKVNMTLISVARTINFCEDYSKHPEHEWTTPVNGTVFRCLGQSTHYRPGDEPQAKKIYRCKREACSRVIKTMAFQGPDEYCSVNCEKIDAGEMEEPVYSPISRVEFGKVLQSGDTLTLRLSYSDPME